MGIFAERHLERVYTEKTMTAMTFQTTRLSWALLLAASSLFLSGCASSMHDHEPRKPSQPPAVGMPNPASAYCIKKGGKVVIQKDRDGNQFGMCHLPDGTQMEEWALFKRDNPPTR
ncbi:MAG: DUF333 domain-containing protein [Ottowia sp.]|uniref:putative hemolysin n=1 Tax=Ottowia sp. TaxID=1898956 RepID=UPI003C761CBF